jgi:predicted ArsR family transcriptional regulator
MYWNQKFFESSRGKVVTLLRRADRTVEELAQELDLTDNGVRVHLATLERDGIVRQRGSKRHGSGGGKPAYIYELTPEAEELFPKAYEPVLSQLLDVLAVQLICNKKLRTANRVLSKPPSFLEHLFRAVAEKTPSRLLDE